MKLKINYYNRNSYRSAKILYRKNIVPVRLKIKKLQSRMITSVIEDDPQIVSHQIS